MVLGCEGRWDAPIGGGEASSLESMTYIMPFANFSLAGQLSTFNIFDSRFTNHTKSRFSW